MLHSLAGCVVFPFIPRHSRPFLQIDGTLFAVVLGATLIRDENFRVGDFPMMKPFHFEMWGFHFEIQEMAPAWGPDSLLTHLRGLAFSEEQLGRDS